MFRANPSGLASFRSSCNHGTGSGSIRFTSKGPLIASATNRSRIEGWARRLRRIALDLIALAVASAVSVGIAESAVRTLAPQPASWLDIYRRHPRLPTFALQPLAERRVHTGETTWVVRTDREGMRIAGPERRDRSARSVLVLGDSYTFGHGVDYTESFVGVLERHFDDRTWHDAAVPGYGPVQYRQVLEDSLHQGMRPELVLVGLYLGNDFHDCVWSKDLPVNDGIVGNPRGLRSFLKRSFHLYRLVASAWHQLSATAATASDAPTEIYRARAYDEGFFKDADARMNEEMSRIAAIAQNASIDLLAVVIPSRASVEARRGTGLDSDLDYDLPLKRASSTLSQAGIRSVDLTDTFARFPAEQVYFRFDGHLTPFGHSLAARAIEDALARD